MTAMTTMTTTHTERRYYYQVLHKLPIMQTHVLLLKHCYYHHYLHTYDAGPEHTTVTDDDRRSSFLQVPHKLTTTLLWCRSSCDAKTRSTTPQREDKMTTRGTDAADATTTPTEDQYANPAHKPWPLTKETTLVFQPAPPAALVAVLVSFLTRCR